MNVIPKRDFGSFGNNPVHKLATSIATNREILNKIKRKHGIIVQTMFHIHTIWRISQHLARELNPT
jgi:hypothetical protein